MPLIEISQKGDVPYSWTDGQVKAQGVLLG